MQRIKGLMSGTLPTFIDAGGNFNSYIINDLINIKILENIVDYDLSLCLLESIE